MFKPAPMRYVNIFVLEEDIERVTIALGRLQVLHLAESEDEEWAHDETGPWSERAGEYAALEGQLDEILDALQIAREPAPALERVEGGGDPSSVRQEIDGIAESVRGLQEQLGSAEKLIECLTMLQEEARAVAPLNVPLEELRSLKHLHLVVGSLPRDSLERLQVVLFRIPFVVVPVSERDDRVLVYAACAQEDEAILNRSLTSAYFVPLELPEGVSGPPDQVLDKVNGRLKRAKARLEALQQKRSQLAEEHKERLLELWSEVRGTAFVRNTISRFGRHGRTYLIAGWVPERDLQRLVETVDATAEEKVDVEVLEVGAGEGTPVQLQNPPFLKPFQNIVSVFGFPGYQEIDPTPIVALTIVLMFGMMFGDLGHGLLLALAGLWLSRRKGGLAPLGPVLTVAGISGAIFGLLYGSLFGREGILPHLWLSPLNDVMTILLTSVGAGVVLLNLGFLLHAADAWWSRDWGSLLFSENGLAGICLYWALLGGGVMLVRGAVPPLTVWGLAVLVPGLVILLREPLDHLVSGARPLVEEGWLMYTVRASFELFESLIAYFTSSISFVRLGAFAVAHAALGQVLFIMADLARGPGRWVIIVAGTAIIVGFEGMVVGIQALRLEYYEFFDKFYRGTGRPFRPFRLPQAGDAMLPGEA